MGINESFLLSYNILTHGSFQHLISDFVKFLLRAGWMLDQMTDGSIYSSITPLIKCCIVEFLHVLIQIPAHVQHNNPSFAILFSNLRAGMCVYLKCSTLHTDYNAQRIDFHVFVKQKSSVITVLKS